jgi:dTDP-4-dehydrorhamnose 3,5-epimerase-like enzyme
MEIEFEKCDAYHDERGDLIQFVTDSFLKEKSLPFGQIYLLTFSHVGVVRGNHYHNHSSEVFCLISGSVEIVCENVDTKERVHKTLKIEADNQFYKIFIGHRVAHAIRSITDFAVMVSFSSEEYSIDKDDKIAYPLL